MDTSDSFWPKTLEKGKKVCGQKKGGRLGGGGGEVAGLRVGPPP